MSKSGDVVWSDGRTWQRFSDLTWQRKDPDSYLIPEEWRNEKRWWVRPMLGGIASQTLANIKQHDDFAWLVKDGIPIVLNALAVYQALDSFADFVAKRDADAELTAERDELRSRLADMTAQRDRAVAKGSELAADLVESERQHDEARDELKSVTARRDELLRDLAITESEWTRLCAQNNSQRVTIESYQESIKELTTQRDHAVEGVAAMTKLRDAELDDNRITWRQNRALREQLDKARGELAEERDQLPQELATVKSLRQKLQRRFDDLNIKHTELRLQFDVAVNDRNILRARCDELERGDRHSCGFTCGQQEERRAVVAWLNKNPQGWARQWSLAGRIERGEHHE